MERFLKLLAIVFSLSLVHCGHLSSKPAARCNALGGGEGEDCFLPYPSSAYLRHDPNTRTGLRVDLSLADLPISRFGTRLSSERYDFRDGFSPVATLLTYFPTKLDSRGLPRPNAANRSLDKESQVQLIEFATGQRVPVFAELDANAEPGEKQALIIQAVVRLKPATRYIAVVQNLRSTEGTTLPPLTGFGSLRDGKPTPTAAPLRLAYEEIFAKLTKYGLKRKNLQVAWDFTTGSDESTVGRLVKMRDEAFAAAVSNRKIRITDSMVHPKKSTGIWKRLAGTFAVPSFLEHGNGNRLALNADGIPKLGPSGNFPLIIHVPDCARTATRPLPILLYGHGTFNSAEREMNTEYSRDLINELCMIQVGTDWLGRAKSDLQYFAFRVIPNWNNFVQITDRLQQAHVNFSYLARLAATGALSELDELKTDTGKPLADSSKIFYYGISEGGCQGVTTLALSPDIQRGALNVPCGFWSMFFWRSSDFHFVRKALKFSYGDPLDHQKLLVLSQLNWDYTDPANYAGHVLRNPLPGNTAKHVLYQEGINDASVPNLTTRSMARELGLKLLGPPVESVEGISEANGSASSAYVQYDIGNRPRVGLSNVPPSISPVHEQVRRLEAVRTQIKRFLRADGRVENTCGGRPCVFQGMPKM